MRPVLTHISSFQIDDGLPTEAGVGAEVFLLRVNREGVHTHLRSEHFNKWLREE